MNDNKRNTFIDVIRGIAMLLVVLGHTMTGSTSESYNSFLFNVVWSLQMPLFILVSGYVTRYSRGCYDGKSLRKFIWRRSLAYLLPWVVWTFVVRGIVLKQSLFLDIKWVAYNMDSGYWFLFTIWTITMCFGLAEFVAKKFTHSNNAEVIITTLFFVCGGVLLLAIGKFMGLNFLCLKLSLYYMPFYWIGYIYGKYHDELLKKKYGNTIRVSVIALSFIVWAYFMFNVNQYLLPDNGTGIILRMICSLAGCIAVFGLCRSLFCNVQSIENHHFTIGGYLQWAGVYSLEIYLCHHLVLNILQLSQIPLFMSAQGIVLAVSNFFLTMLLLYVIILLISQNKYLRFVLFGKR